MYGIEQEINVKLYSSSLNFFFNLNNSTILWSSASLYDITKHSVKPAI